MLNGKDELELIALKILTEIEKEQMLTPVDDNTAGLLGYLRARNNPAFLWEDFDKSQDILFKKKEIAEKEKFYSELEYIKSLSKEARIEFKNRIYEVAGMEEDESEVYKIFDSKKRKTHTGAFIIEYETFTYTHICGVHQIHPEVTRKLQEVMTSQYSNKEIAIKTNKVYKILSSLETFLPDEIIRGNLFSRLYPKVKIKNYLVELVSNNISGNEVPIEIIKKCGMRLIQDMFAIPVDKNFQVIDQDYLKQN